MRAVSFGTLLLSLLLAGHASGQDIPELTAPVNDFAGVVDADSAQTMEMMIRSLQQASGDVVVVATVNSIAPYADVREYAVKMFENRGRGIGQRGKDNGVLVLLAVKERQVRIEVGYDLEQFITDGFAGQVSRETMIPAFRNGNYGAGLRAGVSRVIARIAQGRNVTLQGVPAPRAESPNAGSGGGAIVALIVLFLILNAIAGRTRRRRGSRWHSGVGPFGGPFGGGFGGWGGGGGFGGGGFGGGGSGGGFGGFGGGRSGGGGGGGGW